MEHFTLMGICCLNKENFAQETKQSLVEKVMRN